MNLHDRHHQWHCKRNCILWMHRKFFQFFFPFFCSLDPLCMCHVQFYYAFYVFFLFFLFFPFKMLFNNLLSYTHIVCNWWLKHIWIHEYMNDATDYMFQVNYWYLSNSLIWWLVIGHWLCHNSPHKKKNHRKRLNIKYVFWQ